ncbi:gamma-glutamylcyclotransferase [Glaciecola sp. SC05]|uniref:gamma-glutamylcyclotransferase n=1 Tax=Glaciecola sp. SC05 TaxID=1987355 RepID=UPI003527152E
MSFDTQVLNSRRQRLDDYDELWVFGYASLIYKVDFAYLEQAQANIYGYERRLWQGSSDHRGTPERPGRVATLIPSENMPCFGMAFRVTPEVFLHLDHREKNGYLREEVSIVLLSGREVRGLVYIAYPDNAAFLGDAPIKDLAKHIFQSKGPSGKNKDYVYDLASSLRACGVNDPHIFAVEKALRQLDAP